MNASKSQVHRDLEPLLVPSGMFDVEPCGMDLNIGRFGHFKNPSCGCERETLEIIGVQKNYRGDKCYRVVPASDTHRFGRVARPCEIVIA